MTVLNSVCDAHDHAAGLPDPELRGHALATAIRAAEAVLRSHGYAEPERAIEVVHVALEDALDLEDGTSRWCTRPPASCPLQCRGDPIDLSAT